MLSPEVLAKMAEQIPNSVALIVVILIFVKFLDGQSKQSQNLYRILHEEHLAARLESQKRIQENTEALKENVVATTRNTGMMGDLSRIVERMDRNR